MNSVNVTKLALGIEYNGSAYNGWQYQKKVPSIQARLEHALSVVAEETIKIYCAGRTDAGVHASGQVIHFKTMARRPYAAWTLGVNANLPADIAVRWVAPVSNDFHARFSATARQYRYIIYNYHLRSALLASGMVHYPFPLDTISMSNAGKFLLGEKDFTSFRATHCQSHSSWRNVHHLHVTRQGHYVIVDIKANAFVHHMVRNIVGSLIEVGCGNRPEKWIAELLDCKDRMQASPTAPAEGLYLVAVEYPSYFALPVLPPGPLFLAY